MIKENLFSLPPRGLIGRRSPILYRKLSKVCELSAFERASAAVVATALFVDNTVKSSEFVMKIHTELCFISSILARV